MCDKAVCGKGILKEQLTKLAVLAYLKKYEEDSLKEYSLNEEKIENVRKIAEYCEYLHNHHNCKLIRYICEPAYKQFGVEMLSQNDLPIGNIPEELLKFKEAVNYCDGLNIAANPLGDDYVQLTFFVNDLWIEK